MTHEPHQPHESSAGGARDLRAGTRPKIGLLWRSDGGPGPLCNARAARLIPLMEEIRRLGVDAEPVVFAEDAVDTVRDQLLGLDGVLVWVNPIQDGVNRAVLDSLLRHVAAEGVWVSAHPDVIGRMGTKEVLFWTRHVGWGADTHVYRDAAELRRGLPQALRKDGVRVLKQARGNGGNGVWKVELIRPEHGPGPETMVRVQHAMDGVGQPPEEIALGVLCERLEEYFAWSESIVDHAFQRRLEEGLVRCYLVHDEVVGFCHQWPRGLLDPGSEAARRPTPPSCFEGPDAVAYQPLRRTMEDDWVPEMKATLGLDTVDLPAIWDADFLYGAKTPEGTDTYVLCEINVSAVWPYPNEAVEPLARAAVARVSRRSA